jgi:crotonobetainyl-CoA:carnitine CoA-transferase CaiB-like acyl-CoA transferase
VVNSVDDLPNDPQVLANEYVVDYDHPVVGKTQLMGVPINLSKTPGNARGRAPELGEHSETLLTGLLDYSWEEIAKLKEDGVI